VDRRGFLASVALSLAARRAAHAQPGPTVRIGWLAPDAKPFALDAFREGLKELGWVEAGNLVIEQRYARGAAERYAELAAELVRLKVSILVTDGTPATRAAQRTTTTIPIVFVSANVVERGLVASLSHPGRNLTGVALMAGDLNPKRIQLLKEAVPGLARLAIVDDREGYTYSGSSFRAIDPVGSDSISGAGGPPWCGRSWPWSSGESSLGSCGAMSTPRTWKSWSFATNFRCSVGRSAGLGFGGATASSSPRRAATWHGRPGAPSS
jgi:hypothetical protein